MSIMCSGLVRRYYKTLDYVLISDVYKKPINDNSYFFLKVTNILLEFAHVLMTSSIWSNLKTN